MKSTPIFTLILFTLAFHPVSAQWTPLPAGSSGKYESIYFFDALNGIASANGKVIKTSNGGDSWTTVTVSGVRDINFASPTVGYAAGVVSQAIKKTVNAGTTWTPLTPPTSNSLWGVSVVDANTVYVCGTGAVVWKSTNGGASFSVVDPPGITDLAVDLDFVSATQGCVLSQLGKVFRTTNGGLTWITTYSATGVFFTSIYFVNANTGFAVGMNGHIIKTTDGGVSWVVLNSGSTASLQYVHFFDVNHGIAAGYGGVVLRTTNGGATWFQENTGTTTDLYCCILLSPTVAIAGGDGGLMIRNTNLTTATAEPGAAPPAVHIYPNPNKGSFMVSSDRLVKNIRVFNSFGKLVYQSDEATFGHFIDLPGKVSGMYSVQAEVDGVKQTVKVVVTARD